MRILGIDPGYARIGLGLIDVPAPGIFAAREWLTIETSADTPFPQRLLEIETDFAKFLEESAPDLAVLEKLFFATNEKTALDVAHARGVLCCAIARSGVEILEPTPLQLKSAITGDGAADKSQIQSMLVRMLHLTAIPRPDDAADALALAVYGGLVRQTEIANIK